MSEGYQVSKVTLCVKILKWHPASQRPWSGIELTGQLKNLKLDPLPRSKFMKLLFCFLPVNFVTKIQQNSVNHHIERRGCACLTMTIGDDGDDNDDGDDIYIMVECVYVTKK